VLRCCGLLDDSVAAHARALALDPTVKTSVAHTHFLRGEFARVFETYTGALYYLDAAAWAALGAVDRATSLLRARLSQPSLGSVMASLMASLLAVLEGERDSALGLMQDTGGIREPEVLFYLARHYGMLHSAEPSIQMIRRARLAGFWSSRALRHDPAFTGIRNQPAFQLEIEEATRIERLSDLSLRQTLGFTFAPAAHEFPAVPV
jgi:hypothetical protein